MPGVLCSHIPKFFSRKRLQDPDSTEARFQREVHSRYVAEMTSRSIPSDAELHEISEALNVAAATVEGVQLLSYSVFRSFSQSAPLALRVFFAASVFLSFPRDAEERISLAAFYSFLIDTVSVCHSRLLLAECDALATGFLTENEIDQYVRKVSLPYLENFMNSVSEAQDFLPFFAVTFARRAMIDLDAHGAGRVSAAALFSSELFRNFQATLRRPGGERLAGVMDANYALRLYHAYAGLDRDNDGMLSRAELAEFEGGTISAVVISRVFEEVQNFNRQFDFKGFLEFAMVMENKSRSPRAMRYLFKLLDIEDKGFLNRKDLVYLMNAVIAIIYDKRQLNGAINPQDVADEIFDMLTPKDRTRVTLHDVLASKAGPLVLGILCDANDLFHYENRENYLHSSQTNNSQ